MTLLVVVDATPYGPEPSGSRRRLEEILPRLARLRTDAVFEVHWARDGGGPSPSCAADNVVHATEDVSCRAGAWRLWRRRRALSRRRREAAYTHLLVDHGPLVETSRVRNVVTVHDLRALHGHASPLRAAYARGRYGRVLREAAAVVAVSAAVRDELTAAYGLGNVVVAPNAAAAAFSRAARARTEAALARLGVVAPYVLAVGRDEPRKAMGAAVAAWEAATRSGGPATGVGLVVVGVGPAGLSSAGPRVHRLGFVSDDDLAALYAGASVTLVPSLYEGFSLPVVESLACGTPVVASDIPAHRALAADGARGVTLVRPPAAGAWPDGASALAAALARTAADGDVAPPRSTWEDAAAALAAAM